MVQTATILDAAAKAQHISEVDPHGLIITLVSVSVVFTALILLFLAYTAIGRIASRKGKEDGDSAIEQDVNDENEIAAAVSLALHRYLCDEVHDKESYIITLKRKK